MIIDDPLKEVLRNAHLNKRNILRALTRWRIWLHVIYCICGVACVAGVNTYNAQIVANLGFATSQANALSSVGSWAQAPLTLLWGYVM